MEESPRIRLTMTLRFRRGLDLDSIDALELVVMLERDYGIVIKDIEEGRPAFQSVRDAGGHSLRPAARLSGRALPSHHRCSAS